MPNIDFYALDRDFTAVLDYVFEQSGCRVFESSSRLGEELVEFKSTADLSSRYEIGKCRSTGASVLLQLVPPCGAHLIKVGVSRYRRRGSAGPRSARR